MKSEYDLSRREMEENVTEMKTDIHNQTLENENNKQVIKQLE